MCLYPKLLRNRKYMPNKKNGGVPPEPPKIKVNGKWIIDERVLWVPIGCGKCMECLKMKGNEWKVRLNEELRTSDTRCHFVTLTFSNESYKTLYKKYFKDVDLNKVDIDNLIAKKGVRLFLERWRRRFKKSVKHWLITELGHQGTENIHLHGLIWTNSSAEVIRERWGYGFIWDSTEDKEGYVSERTINYIIKYCTKLDEKHKTYKPIILCSSGLGKGYLKRIDSKRNQYKGKNTNENYKLPNGHEVGLPIYYRNKLYSDKMKEQLWIKKLDENVRYVNGAKINVSTKKGMEEYYRKLHKAQLLNESLGYGDDRQNWKLKQYEAKRKRLNFEKRINSVN